MQNLTITAAPTTMGLTDPKGTMRPHVQTHFLAAIHQVSASVQAIAVTSLTV